MKTNAIMRVLAFRQLSARQSRFRSPRSHTRCGDGVSLQSMFVNRREEKLLVRAPGRATLEQGRTKYPLKEKQRARIQEHANLARFPRCAVNRPATRQGMAAYQPRRAKRQQRLRQRPGSYS